jgi:hypothetical protein
MSWMRAFHGWVPADPAQHIEGYVHSEKRAEYHVNFPLEELCNICYACDPINGNSGRMM